MSNKQTITLGIITYNEGNELVSLLTQLSSYANEIVIVDSFSTDNTADIAAKYNAKYINMKFDGSFSNLRNKVVENATSDYILMLDCDERLENPDAFFAKNFIADAYMLPRKNYIDGKQVNVDNLDWQGRLFKNNGKIKYYLSVHELLTDYNSLYKLQDYIIHDKSMEKLISNDTRYKKIISNSEVFMNNLDMADDDIFKGWYSYEKFPNGAASRWCSDNGTVTFECDDPATQAIGIYISTVGKFNKARFTVKAGRKVVGKIEVDVERGKVFIPVNVSECAPCTLTLNIKCWDLLEFIPEPRTLGIFVDSIWLEQPGKIGTLKLIFDKEASFEVKGDIHDDCIIQNIINSGYWETATQMVIDKFVKPTDVCFDVGANIGSITIPLAYKAEQVYAFEVGSIPMGYLRHNILKNNITNVEVIRGAVADKPGKLYYHYTYPNTGGSFVSTEILSKEAIVEQIDSITLDSVANKLDKLDFIKMDIEGYELSALHGATKLLAKFKPKLYVEFNPYVLEHIHNKNPEPFWNFLSNEYEFIYVVRDSKLRRVSNYTDVMRDISLIGMEDLLCLHESIDIETMEI